MNTTIGRWNNKNLAIRDELRTFMFFNKELAPQRGSLLYDGSCNNHARLWEYATALELSQPEKQHRILDVGGLNNLLGWFLHKKGCNIIQYGLRQEDLDNLEKNKSKIEQSNEITGHCKDFRTTNYFEQFNIVYCINVIEHVREVARTERGLQGWTHGKSNYWDSQFNGKNLFYEVEQEKIFVQNLANAVKPGGLLVITFDYNNHGSWKRQDKCAYMRDIHDVESRIIENTGLSVVGGIDYQTEYPVDCKPPASTGIIVLKKD